MQMYCRKVIFFLSRIWPYSQMLCLFHNSEVVYFLCFLLTCVVIDLCYYGIYIVEDESNFFRRSNSYSGSIDHTSLRKTSRLTPTGSPKVISSMSPRGYDAAGFHLTTSAPPSPRTLYEGLGSLSSSQQSAANSPPCGLPLPGP